MFRMNDRIMLLHFLHFRHPWLPPENGSCAFKVSAIHGGRMPRAHGQLFAPAITIPLFKSLWAQPGSFISLSRFNPR
ncbi:hypothetical protein A8C75_16075 [Marinobacterium aestuarii]|uniref:Uncharacterized protein n=1 Tax=Marinobacterium aestuarii TaxID=1821621 RepID=A0A1A9F173_9GAMM|nr:hypothetical protein A8C75_16075 [Marinobacterium aestuarii]